jgi:hypothetical protein
MARSLYSIKGTLFTSTSRTEKTQSELYDEIRALPGVVTLNTKTLDKEKIALVIKVDPYPYGGKFTEEVHNKIISEIKEIPGVRKFNVYESPFIKAEPKTAFNPIPTSYDNRKRTDSNSGQSISDKS